MKLLVNAAARSVGIDFVRLAKGIPANVLK
jgi:hypothetical protein